MSGTTRRSPDGAESQARCNHWGEVALKKTHKNIQPFSDIKEYFYILMITGIYPQSDSFLASCHLQQFLLGSGGFKLIIGPCHALDL